MAEPRGPLTAGSLTQRLFVLPYNVQVVTDAKHKLIVANDVTNDPTDSDQLAPMAICAKEVLEVETLEATADMGYAHGEQVKQCERAKIVAYVPKPHTSRSQRKGLFTKDDFRYDATNDTYICPNDAILTFRFQTTEKGRDTRYYATNACGSCPIKTRFLRTLHFWVGVWGGEAAPNPHHWGGAEGPGYPLGAPSAPPQL
ncbi:MAG TPA: hypothetical protein VKK81_07380 [Candidatus Binatia bacterium]|nr:hypothetical protein [Candidatus Binatia bacterium]